MKRTAFVLLILAVFTMTVACQGRRRIVVTPVDSGATETAVIEEVTYVTEVVEEVAVAETMADEMPPAGGSGDEMLDTNAEAARIAKAKADFLASSFVDQAEAALRNGNVEMAKDLYAKAIDADPMNKEARKGWRALSNDRGSNVGEYMEGQRSVAQVRREKAATEVRSYIDRGRSLEAREQFEGAVKEYQKALAHYEAALLEDGDAKPQVLRNIEAARQAIAQR